MAQPVGVTHAAVIAAASDLINDQGLQALSLTAIAHRLQIRVPSLYAHVDGLDGLRRDLALHGVMLLREELETAVSGLTRRAALAAVAETYRSFARTNPGLYTATLRDPGDDAELRTANEAALSVVIEVLKTFNLPEDELLHSQRTFWSALHGFNVLVATGVMTMPTAVETSYQRIVEIFDFYFESVGRRRRR